MYYNVALQRGAFGEQLRKQEWISYCGRSAVESWLQAKAEHLHLNNHTKTCLQKQQPRLKTWTPFQKPAAIPAHPLGGFSAPKRCPNTLIFPFSGGLWHCSITLGIRTRTLQYPVSAPQQHRANCYNLKWRQKSCCHTPGRLQNYF